LKKTNCAKKKKLPKFINNNCL